MTGAPGGVEQLLLSMQLASLVAMKPSSRCSTLSVFSLIWDTCHFLLYGLDLVPPSINLAHVLVVLVNFQS